MRQLEIWILISDNGVTNIDSCTIKNNDIGVEVYNSSNVVVRNSVIDSNSTNGIYCHSGSHIVIKGNSIKNNPVGIFNYSYSHPTIKEKNTIQNNGVGIKCDYYSHAVVESTTITYNQIGVFAFNNSNPDLGHQFGGLSDGYNSIHHSTSHHVVNLSPSVEIKAERNYWGNRGPLPRKFSGAVDYNPYLPQEPDLAPDHGFEEDEQEIGDRIPDEFALFHNYPNPFNPITYIKYQVPPPGSRLSIVIYNVKGQLVKTLLDEYKSPGFYLLDWDGRNEKDQNVATGIYFVRMKAMDFKATTKILLLK